MRQKDIEAAREVRLWLGQIVIPAVTMVMLIPDAREAVVRKAKEMKNNLDQKLKK